MTSRSRTTSLTTGITALLLALAGTVLTGSAASAAYTVTGVYSYRSLSTCSSEMDRYAQRHVIIQGCTVTVRVNGVPTQWRLMIGR